MTKSNTVAFLGPEASYTHQASLATFDSSNHEFVPITTIPAIFAAVQSGATEYGVVPFSNTTYGPVVATLDSLATTLHSSASALSNTSTNPPVPAPTPSASHRDSDATYPDIRVRSDVTLPIRHCLLGHSPQGISLQAADSTSNKWQHIARVYSHEQALGQCAHFLTTHLPHAERIVDTSTSRAAERVAAAAPTSSGAVNGASGTDAARDTAAAAISSEMAAQLYGVPVLARDIQDNDDNMTRFLVLQRRPTPPRDNAALADSRLEGQRTSLVVFTVGHAAPGALARCLAVLDKHGLNAVGIQQRPPTRRRTEDAIFVEVQGPLGGVEEAVGEFAAAGLTGACTWLGSW